MPATEQGHPNYRRCPKFDYNRRHNGYEIILKADTVTTRSRS